MGSWEKGKFKPKGDQKAALVALPKVNKREVKELLEKRGEREAKRESKKMRVNRQKSLSRKRERGTGAKGETNGVLSMKRRSLTMTLSLCSLCKHKHQDSLTFRNSFPTCDAFPNGIPEAVRKNRIDHRKALAGDNGIRFELAADSETSSQLLDSFDSWFEKQKGGMK